MDFVRHYYFTEKFIPLHAPIFVGEEKKYVLETIDSTFVSSVGGFVTQFEQSFAKYIGAQHAVATVNGTSALHIALKLVGAAYNTEIITQSLTFVATCNAIRYCQAEPVFVDVAKDSLGMCPDSLAEFLFANAELRDGVCYNKHSNRPIRACVPMHTFGFPCEIDRIVEICRQYNIRVVEDAAEALGSRYQDKRAGTFSDVAIFSFNGNKIMTTGGGGMIVTDDERLAARAKHLTSTAKQAHAWEYIHDEVAYNYRMPNLNAALGCAQLESLPLFLEKKRELANHYREFFTSRSIKFISEPSETQANYWLNTILLNNKDERDDFLQMTNAKNIMTRPAWRPMHRLPIYKDSLSIGLPNTDYLADRIVNIPSSPSLESADA